MNVPIVAASVSVAISLCAAGLILISGEPDDKATAIDRSLQDIERCKEARFTRDMIRCFEKVTAEINSRTAQLNARGWSR